MWAHILFFKTIVNGEGGRATFFVKTQPNWQLNSNSDLQLTVGFNTIIGLHHHPPELQIRTGTGEGLPYHN